MADHVQTQFWGINGNPLGRDERCLVSDQIDPEDSACHGLEKSNYETLECGTKKGLRHLMDCRGATLLNIYPIKQQIPELPNFIPHGVPAFSGYFLRDNNIPWIGIGLPSILSPVTLKVYPDIRKRIGVSPDTKILLLNYGPDALIERIWNHRNTVLPAIAKSNVDLMTSFDFSVFLDQPHLESVVNIKRNLVTYEILQSHGATVIPHLYWRGDRSIEILAQWLNIHPSVTHITNYQGLQKTEEEWQRELSGLQSLREQIDHEVRLIISGPSTPSRIFDVKRIWPNAIITNGVGTLSAIVHTNLSISDVPNCYPLVPFSENATYYQNIVDKAERDLEIIKKEVILPPSPTFTVQKISQELHSWTKSKITMSPTMESFWKGGEQN